ncbi:MAG: thiamine phosphate synthase [Phycisphaerales bacterium]|nr:MAG: thiamine phosphate synthase [Phycisphaerales bacterium]
MHPIVRMIDANANRACEAARVLEDLARFVLGAGEVAAGLKSLRHDLRRAIGSALGGAGIDPVMLAAWRDPEGDPGTGLSHEGEVRRAGTPAIASAAAGRLGEALRAIEESLKTIDSGRAGEVEKLRYASYALSRRVELALGTGRASQWRVCVLLTESLCTHHSWEEVARLAIEGGADCVQLREKSMESGELVERARALVGIARPAGVSVIVNDRPDIALLAGADGVHVGQNDLCVRDVRRIAGSGLLVGVSTAHLEQARRAVAEGADYIGCGPMFASATKVKPVLSGPSFVGEVVGDAVCGRVSHLAISGITPENIGELVGAGCRGVAVSGVVCGAEEPAGVCRALRAALEGAERG